MEIEFTTITKIHDSYFSLQKQKLIEKKLQIVKMNRKNKKIKEKRIKKKHSFFVNPLENKNNECRI